MSVSKFVELSKKRLPHDKRTKRLYGEKDDTNKFFKCWNCGFIVDSQKHPVHPDSTGVTHNSFTSFPDWVNLMALENTNEHELEILCEDNGTTNILVSGTLYYSDISIGCPFCGTPNYR